MIWSDGESDLFPDDLNPRNGILLKLEICVFLMDFTDSSTTTIPRPPPPPAPAASSESSLLLSDSTLQNASSRVLSASYYYNAIDDIDQSFFSSFRILMRVTYSINLCFRLFILHLVDEEESCATFIVIVVIIYLCLLIET